MPPSPHFKELKKIDASILVACGMDPSMLGDADIPGFESAGWRIIGSDTEPAAYMPLIPGGRYAFCSDIENLGDVDPCTGGIGLAILKNHVVYDGSFREFIHCFQNYTSVHAPLGRMALYLETGAILQMENGVFKMFGSGGVCFCTTRPGKLGKPDIRIAQYRPGEQFPVPPVTPD